jgi:cystathionine beta-lyase/cystathionine gamma-synthase
VGSFASVDVLDVADIIITSFTKSFSGLANVMGGSHMYYPPTNRDTLPYYQQQMRALTSVFRPGYGGLFTLQFVGVKAAMTFFNA